MSAKVDNRVVEMQFDNSHFESNVKTSLGTIEKLKSALNFGGASKGLADVNTAAKSVDMGPLGSAVETVKAKFSALQIMATTALANITNSAVNAGKNLVKAFTIEPIKAGFQEYETQINSVQTVLANTQSKGTTLSDVNSALDELNLYADKTIYNFTEMTRNIGTFTAAGVDLETSVSAIKGIANLAAVSGSNSQQASTAMYQLSQALASGTVKLMDWNSVVNAGMGGQVFQDSLKETARAHGIAIDDMIEKAGSFRETLKDEWLTSDVLLETLSKFTGDLSAEQLKSMGYTEEQIKGIVQLGQTANDAATKVKTFTQLKDTLKEATQSGWTQTWETLVGDFEEAKELWTDVSDRLGGMISKSSESRNTKLESAMSSNWDKLINKVNEAGYSTDEFEDKIKSVMLDRGYTESGIKAFGDLEKAFRSGKIHASVLTDSVEELYSKLNLSSISSSLTVESKGKDIEKTWDKMVERANKAGISTEEFEEKVRKSAEKAGYSIKDLEKGYDAGLKEFLAMGEIDVGVLQSAAAELDEVANKSKEVKGTIDETTASLIDGITELGGRENLIEGFKNIFNSIMDIIAPIKEAFRNIFPETTAEQIYKFTENFKKLTEQFKISDETASKIKSTFEGMFSVIDIVATVIGKVISGIAKLIGSFSGLGGSILSATGSLGDWLSGLRDSIHETDIFGKAIDKIVGFVQKAIDKIKSFGSSIADSFNLSGFLGAFKNIAAKIVDVASTIGKAFANAFRSGDIGNALDIFNSGLFAGLLVGINRFVNNLTGSFKGVKDLLGGLKDILNGALGCFEAWQTKIKADVLTKIATAVALLAGSLLLIAMIEPERLTDALGAITVLFAELMVAMSLFGEMSGTLGKVGKSCAVMIAMGAAILLLAGALKTIGELDFESMMTGLVGVIGLMGALVGAIKLLDNGGNKIMKGATQIVIFAAAVAILASVCKSLSGLSWEELGKGLGGVLALMMSISLFANTMKNSSLSVGTAVAIVAIAGAIKILASACADFAGMSWEEIGKGLASVGGLLLEIAGFAKLTNNVSGMISSGVALIAIAAAMKIFASVMSDLSGLSWEEIAKGLAGMAGALLAVAAAVNLMPKNIIGISAGLVIASAAMLMLADVMQKMAGLSWEEIAKGLVAIGGALGLLAGGLHLMKGTLSGSAALLVAAAALLALTPALKALGSMSWGELAVGLAAVAGAIAVFGIAAAVLQPIIPAMIGLGAAVTLLGIGCLAAGVGITALAVGLATLGTSVLVAGSSIVELILIITDGLGEIIVSVCNSIANSAGAIAEAIVAVIEAACYTITESLPLIAETIFGLLVSLLGTLRDYIPQLVDVLADILVDAMNKLSERIPEVVDAAMNLIGKFLSGLDAALGQGGLSNLINSLHSVAEIMVALGLTAKIVSTIPISGALTGIASMAIFVGGLALLLTALGGLAQIPGLTWLVDEGAKLLSQIGSAIGGFVGSIAGGFMTGATNDLPQVGENLSEFMDSIQPFLDGVSNIDSSVVDNVGSLVKAIGSLSAVSMLNSGFEWLTGDNSLASFGPQLAEFGTHLKAFSDNVAGIDEGAITSAAGAAKAIAEMADTVPNEGGMVAWFTGDNSLAEFGPQMAEFGAHLKTFADNVSGIDTGAITAAADAAAAITGMADTVPNEGGLAALFAGDNSLAAFGPQMAEFGAHLKTFADNVAGLDADAITGVAGAAKAITEMADTVPDEGGIKAWFAGDNSLAKFGPQMAEFGAHLKAFADNVAGIDTGAITSAAGAGKALAEMANTVPDTGGVVSWFAGDNSLASFGPQIAEFGTHLKTFADNVAGIDTTSVTAAADAGKTLAQMADTVPDTGGVAAWFAGENSLASFGPQIAEFGTHLKTFADNVAGIDTVSVTAAADAGKTLAQMADTVPDTGGIVAWFAGENSLASFGENIANFGTHLKAFADNVAGIDTASVTAAADVGKTLAEMSATVPDTGGIAAWFAGDNSLASFGPQIAEFGTHLKAFADNVAGLDVASVDAATTAATSLVDMTNAIPEKKNLATFGNQLTAFGANLKLFVEQTAGLDTSAIPGLVKDISEAMKSLGEVADEGITSFNEAIKKAKPDVEAAAGEIIASITETASSRTSEVTAAFSDVCTAAIQAIESNVASFYSAGANLVYGFANGITATTFAAKAAASAMANAALKAAEAALDEHSPSREFYAVGEFAGMGLVNALSDYETKSYKAGSGMASSALDGLRNAIGKIKNVVANDIDAQPTIRPVLDLSDVTAGANRINGLFGRNPSVGVMSNVGVISSMMNKGQNGANDDVISAIRELKDSMNNTPGNTYQINGITYDDGSNVSDAIKTLVRAAKIEGRR